MKSRSHLTITYYFVLDSNQLEYLGFFPILGSDYSLIVVENGKKVNENITESRKCRKIEKERVYRPEAA